MLFIGRLRNIEEHHSHHTNLYPITQHINLRILLESSIWCEQSAGLFILC